MPRAFDRRQFIKGAGQLTAALAAPHIAKPGVCKPNILLFLTDQEQGLASWPKGLIEKLPGHASLLQRGLHVRNYHVHTTPCGPSRSTIFCGQHTQATGMYVNPDTDPFPQLDESTLTIGHIMRAAGYHTSYRGKWHLSHINRDRGWNQVPGGIFPATRSALEKYGFDDYSFDGEATGLTWDGYRADQFIAAETARSIIDFGEGRGAVDKPWLMVCALVNPHDIMFFDATGTQSEDRANPDLLGPFMREPGDPLYAEDNGFELPESFFKDDLTSKPEAHRAAQNRNDAFYGKMALDDLGSWRRFINYYYNCLRDVDRRIEQVLWALERSGQAENTIIVLTADHGERAGAHGLRQKSGTIYREETNVPMIIVHPDLEGERSTDRLMSAIDILPTLAGLAGYDDMTFRDRFAGLPGVDVSSMIADANVRTERDVRGHLFNYASCYGWAPRSPESGASSDTDSLANSYDLSKRRLHRGVFDGRWKFARYFAPAQHHIPQDWGALVKYNDLELYDTRSDPGEIVNLAAREDQKSNLLRLNQMTNRLIATEVGDDNGAEYPGATEHYRLSTDPTLAGAGSV